MGQLDKRVAIITGARRGIGKAIALAYAREGAQLVLAAHTRVQLAQTVQEVEACGAETCLITTDVTEAAQVAQMVRLTLERFTTMEDTLSLAHAVREACRTAAVRAYEDAGLGGLCHEGRWG
jgi:NAD(P)-dependent dehydrogenase (short-subunit alcohol dehydrogenase family)